MGRRLLVVSACALLSAGSTHGAPPVAWVKTDQLVRAGDGTQLATTLYTPGTVSGPPPAGWPAIIMFHGLGGTRASMNAIAEQTFVREGYVVLTADHRGHGESGGLFDADGPREIRDARDLFDWLASRPDVDRSHIGAWGISLGGGVVWGALKAGVPFAAAEVCESWVDLFEALAPNKLPKSGAILGFLNSVPSERLSPDLDAIKGQVGNGADATALRRYADARSVDGSLGKIETPVLVFQGRRDFAFGLGR